MHILTPYNSKAIINNIESIFENNDIEKLNNPTYRFVYMLSGFIANYNLNGFQSVYNDLRTFANDLLDGCSESEERRSIDPWGIREYGQAYCQSKADAIKGIREVVIKYQERISQEAETEDIQKLENLRDIINDVLKRKDSELTKNLVHTLELR